MSQDLEYSWLERVDHITTKVHHTKCMITHTHAGTHTHTHTHTHIHTYIMHNAITQSGEVKQILPTFQGYGLARYMKCKTDIAIPRERGPIKEQEKLKGTRRGGTPIHALEKRLRERGKEKTT